MEPYPLTGLTPDTSGVVPILFPSFSVYRLWSSDLGEHPHHGEGLWLSLRLLDDRCHDTQLGQQGEGSDLPLSVYLSYLFIHISIYLFVFLASFLFVDL